MSAEDCRNKTVLDQELWALHSQTSVQLATCLMLEGTRSCKTLPWGVHIQLFPLQRRGREASMMFAAVVIVILVKEVLICLWGLWSWCFQHSHSGVCMFINKVYLAVWFWLSVALGFLYNSKLPVFLCDPWSLQEMPKNLWHHSRVPSLL